MKRKSALIIFIVAFLMVTPSVAQFGIVHDPIHQLSNFVQFVALKINQVAQYALTVTHVAYTLKHLEFVISQTVQIPNKLERWATDMIHLRATGVYSDANGTNNAYLKAINEGLNTANAYLQYTERLENQPLTTIAGMERNQRRYSQMEWHDGVNARLLAVIGDYRTTQRSRNNALTDLKTATLNERNADNTTTAILQKTNAVGLLTAQNTEMLGELISSQMELQLRQSMSEREEVVAAMNDRTYMIMNAPAFMDGQANRTTAAMHFPIP